eukprot:TRINITY_DN5970_c0_g1_i2.p1 TRINITY_DN5970_c0_g1~~TRINITY_DN5970_c0_g1_i2.p1  ORF type:complete len:268 (+),score=18.38 TRINITY_DN5970_c0_g1_i2:65-868(+)
MDVNNGYRPSPKRHPYGLSAPTPPDVPQDLQHVAGLGKSPQEWHTRRVGRPTLQANGTLLCPRPFASCDGSLLAGPAYPEFGEEAGRLALCQRAVGFIWACDDRGFAHPFTLQPTTFLHLGGGLGLVPYHFYQNREHHKLHFTTDINGGPFNVSMPTAEWLPWDSLRDALMRNYFQEGRTEAIDMPEGEFQMPCPLDFALVRLSCIPDVHLLPAAPEGKVVAFGFTALLTRNGHPLCGTRIQQKMLSLAKDWRFESKSAAKGEVISI